MTTAAGAERDWAQIHETARDNHQLFCPGCGYHTVLNNGDHRDDCPTLKEHD
jgi:hypothetical protein